MSRMKSMAVAALHAGVGVAASAARRLGASTSTEQVAEPTDRRERRRARRQSAKTQFRPFWARRENRYDPHQGKREIARRRRQIKAGKLRFFVPGVTAEAVRFQPEPTPVKASTLIENGLEAERRAKRSEAARKAARTRAARKLEAANG